MGSGFLKGLTEEEEAGTTGGGRGAEETAGVGEGSAWATARAEAGEAGERRRLKAASLSDRESIFESRSCIGMRWSRHRVDRRWAPPEN